MHLVGLGNLIHGRGLSLGLENRWLRAITQSFVVHSSWWYLVKTNGLRIYIRLWPATETSLLMFIAWRQLVLVLTLEWESAGTKIGLLCVLCWRYTLGVYIVGSSVLWLDRLWCHWILHQGRIDNIAVFGLLRWCARDLLLLCHEALLKFSYFFFSSHFLALDLRDYRLLSLLLRNILRPSDEFAWKHCSDTTSICWSARYLWPTLHL